nr:hypothetical protein [bacterium]
MSRPSVSPSVDSQSVTPGAAPSGHKQCPRDDAHHGHEHGCCCHSAHGHEHEQDEEQSPLVRLVCIALSITLLVAGLLLPAGGWRLAAFIAALAVIGWDIMWGAVTGLIHGHMLDENFLMSIAAIGA